MNKLIEALRVMAPQKKPTVTELAVAAGVEKVSAQERDAAWVAYQAEKEVSVGYRITVKKDGFRRAGRAWRGTTLVAPGELSEEQLAALEADPMFHVEKEAR